MTPEAQRIAIAEACGWTNNPARGWYEATDSARCWFLARRNDGQWMSLPDFLNDLNAMNQAEKVITDDQWPIFRDLLQHLAFLSCDPKAKFYRPLSATASQRAEAFLKTIGKWVNT